VLYGRGLEQVGILGRQLADDVVDLSAEAPAFRAAKTARVCWRGPARVGRGHLSWLLMHHAGMELLEPEPRA
jgi:hypothetical protein